MPYWRPSADTFTQHTPMDSLARLNPEQQARVRIDQMLEAAGWKVQDYSRPNINAGRGSLSASSSHRSGAWTPCSSYSP
jgi:hypothetical protein